MTFRKTLRKGEGKHMGDVVNQIEDDQGSTTVYADDSTKHNNSNNTMSIQRAVDLLEQAAETGLPSTMFLLSKLIKQTDGKRAHELLSNASSQEQPDAQHTVGVLLLQSTSHMHRHLNTTVSSSDQRQRQLHQRQMKKERDRGMKFLKKAGEQLQQRVLTSHG